MSNADHLEDVGPGHGTKSDADRKRLIIALAVIVVYMVGEVVAGIISGSLALLADAGHMLTDAGAIGLSLFAMRLAVRPPQRGMTFGLKRAEILSALANGVTLLVIAALIIFEGVVRVLSSPHVDATVMLVVALIGIVVNLLATWQLAKANRQSLNVEGSFQHILTDLFAFIGTAIAAVVILGTGFQRADPIASFLVAALMLRAAYGLIRDAGRVLLEAAPEGMDSRVIRDALLSHPAVTDVHDFHLWEVTSGFPSLSAHVLVRQIDDCHATRLELEQLLGDRFHIEHTTLQVDHDEQDRLLTINMNEDRFRQW